MNPCKAKKPRDVNVRRHIPSVFVIISQYGNTAGCLNYFDAHDYVIYVYNYSVLACSSLFFLLLILTTTTKYAIIVHFEVPGCPTRRCQSEQCQC